MEAGCSAPSGVRARQEGASTNDLRDLVLRTRAKASPPGQRVSADVRVTEGDGGMCPESPERPGVLTCILNPRPLPSDGHEETSLGEKWSERGNLAGFADGDGR